MSNLVVDLELIKVGLARIIEALNPNNAPQIFVQVGTETNQTASNLAFDTENIVSGQSALIIVTFFGSLTVSVACSGAQIKVVGIFDGTLSETADSANLTITDAFYIEISDSGGILSGSVSWVVN